MYHKYESGFDAATDYLKTEFLEDYASESPTMTSQYPPPLGDTEFAPYAHPLMSNATSPSAGTWSTGPITPTCEADSPGGFSQYDNNYTHQPLATPPGPSVYPDSFIGAHPQDGILGSLPALEHCCSPSSQIKDEYPKEEDGEGEPDCPYDDAASPSTPSDFGGNACGSSTTFLKDNDGKSLPYSKLLHRAFMETPGHALTLPEIYEWFKQNTSKGASEVKGWQNSVRHNLSMNKAFSRRERHPNGARTQAGTPRKASEWVLEEEFLGGVQSTTRYRDKTNVNQSRGHNKMSSGVLAHRSRAESGRKGGLTAGRNRRALGREQAKMREMHGSYQQQQQQRHHLPGNSPPYFLRSRQGSGPSQYMAAQSSIYPEVANTTTLLEQLAIYGNEGSPYAAVYYQHQHQHQHQHQQHVAEVYRAEAVASNYAWHEAAQQQQQQQQQQAHHMSLANEYAERAGREQMPEMPMAGWSHPGAAYQP